ncbi:MAG TPA: sugar ABC transporter permease [Jiangellaceae bacterium]|nr:sugar ABC transporter permease [Jiangellaceae bacterium]
MTRPAATGDRQAGSTAVTLPSVAAGEEVPLAGPSRRRGRRRGPSVGAILLFLLPGLVLFGVLVVLPILGAGYVSVFRWNGFGGLPPISPTSEFIGLDNFVRAFGDPVFLGDLWRGFVLVALSLTIQLPAALALALLLHQKFPGRTVFRLLFFAPYVISEVITAALFSMVLSPRFGLANNLLEAVGLGELVPEAGWLGDRSIVLYVVFFVLSWKYFGFHMIIYLAGRQNIPNELTEAAMTDGATGWQVFRYVTLPLMGPTIRVTIFLSIIGVIQQFDMVWVLTGGGPVNASETLAVTMYKSAFERAEFGYGSAISVLMFVLAMVFALGYVRFVMRRDIEGAVTTMGGRR